MRAPSLLLASALAFAGRASACLGPPYLYLTMHGGEDKGEVNQVYIYSRDGCALGEALEEYTELNELRGMALWGDSMLLANANRQESFIVQYKGACRSMESMKEMRVIVPFGTPGIDHPYGVTTDRVRYLYVSTQGSNSVYRYFLTTGEAAPVSPALAEEGVKDEDYPGLFVQFDQKTDGTRNVAWHPEHKLLFIANKDEGVVVLDEDGYEQGRLDADKPISVSYCEGRDSIFVSSKGDDSVSEWDPRTFERLGKWKDWKLSHPAGLVCHEGSLFVVSQDKNSILEVDLESGKVWVVVDELDDKGEQLILSHANRC